MITSSSISRLHDFERCKFFAWLKYDQKIPEPQRPLPSGKLEHANDRGTRVHDGCELYVKGESDELPPEAELYFGPQIDLLRVLHAEGLVSTEGEWGYDKDWVPMEYRSAWLRVKLDAMVRVHKHEAVVIDYKTGKKYGNEMKHAEQMMVYAAATVMRYPEIEVVTTELWYLDQNEVTSQRYLRSQALRLRLALDSRMKRMTSATEFPAAKNKFACKWCQYGPWNGGQCQEGVR